MSNQLRVSEQKPEARVPIHGAEAFAGMHRAGRLAAEVLDMITEHVQPGVTTGELDRLCHEFILERDATPAPLNYRGYPKPTCISVNYEVCHGIPGERRLQEGDILNIHVTGVGGGWDGGNPPLFFPGPPP